jgi:hypothetical protein
MNTCDRAKRALWYKSGLPHDSKGYVKDVQQNLVSGVRLEKVEIDYSQGSGQELASKMRAIHSSSALVANTFGRWKDDSAKLRFLGYSSFQAPMLEAQCRTGLGGTPPNLDVLLKSSSVVIGIESKLLEPLGSLKKPSFSESYSRDKLPQCEEPWWDLLEEVRHWEPSRFDAAQLIKHYLGLRKQFPSGHKVYLVYLFWKPLNAESIPEYSQHAEDMERFRNKTLDNGNEGVQFIATDYLELWESWSKDPDSDLANHAKLLKQRYCMEI